jgi:hypothetical protein
MIGTVVYKCAHWYINVLINVQKAELSVKNMEICTKNPLITPYFVQKSVF